MMEGVYIDGMGDNGDKANVRIADKDVLVASNYKVKRKMNKYHCSLHLEENNSAAVAATFF